MSAIPESPEASTSQEAVGSEDLRLAAAVLRKDRKATAEFVSLHADGVYSYVRSRLIPQTDGVDDIVQEVFLAAWMSLPRFQGVSSLRTWIMGIARHKVEDHYRARMRHLEPTDGDELESLLPAQEPRLEEFMDKERLARKIRDVLASLPEIYRLALLWRYWEKRSARDIAVETGKTEKAVERILARAREQFKRSWKDG